MKPRLAMLLMLLTLCLQTALCVHLAGCAGPDAQGACARPRATTAEATVPEPPSTFSIVAYDPANGDLGVAVQSKFFAVGAVVPWAEAGVGAIATQSYANVSYGPRGLELLRQGLSSEEVVLKLASNDPDRARRQLAVVDRSGRSANLTGKECLPWAGARSGPNYSVQGNILVSEATVLAMETAFLTSRGELAERLLAALEAAQKAGGDARGRQSAAILVVRKDAGYGGGNDRYIDLRVDDHPRPIEELRRLVEVRLGKDPLSRGRALERRGAIQEALSVLRQAQAKHPGWEALAFEEARLLLTAGKTAEGQAALATALERAGGQDDAHYLAAQLLAGAGLEDEALGELRQTLSLNQEYVHAIRRDLASSENALSRLKERVLSLLNAPRAGQKPGGR